MYLGNNRIAILILSVLVLAFGAYAQNETQNQAQNFGEAPPAPAVDPTAAPAIDPATGQPVTEGTANESPLSSMMQPYEYLDLGRKDPFQRPMIEKPLPPGAFHGPVLPLQKFTLDQLQLIGIIWDVARPRAMLKDPQGKIHVLGPNSKIGNQNGYIAAIREGELVVIETFEEEGKLRSDVRIVKLSLGKGATAK